MDCLFDSLSCYLGRTVTIFTTSGGLSGSGFTGVLVSVCKTHVKIITSIGAAPACPVGSACTGCLPSYGYGCGYGGYGGGCGYGGGYGYGGCCGNWLGSVTEIPLCTIASFTHNAI